VRFAPESRGRIGREVLFQEGKAVKILAWLERMSFAWALAYGGVLLSVEGLHEMREQARVSYDEQDILMTDMTL